MLRDEYLDIYKNVIDSYIKSVETDIKNLETEKEEKGKSKLPHTNRINQIEIELKACEKREKRLESYKQAIEDGRIIPRELGRKGVENIIMTREYGDLKLELEDLQQEREDLINTNNNATIKVRKKNEKLIKKIDQDITRINNQINRKKWEQENQFRNYYSLIFERDKKACELVAKSEYCSGLRDNIDEARKFNTGIRPVVAFRTWRYDKQDERYAEKIADISDKLNDLYSNNNQYFGSRIVKVSEQLFTNLKDKAKDLVNDISTRIPFR